MSNVSDTSVYTCKIAKKKVQHYYRKKPFFLFSFLQIVQIYNMRMRRFSMGGGLKINTQVLSMNTRFGLKNELGVLLLLRNGNCCKYNCLFMTRARKLLRKKIYKTNCYISVKTSEIREKRLIRRFVKRIRVAYLEIKHHVNAATFESYYQDHSIFM